MTILFHLSTLELAKRYRLLEKKGDIISLRKKSNIANALIRQALDQDDYVTAFDWRMINFGIVRDIEINHISNEWNRSTQYWDEIISGLPENSAMLADAYFASGCGEMKSAGVSNDYALGNSIRKLKAAADIYNTLPYDYQGDKSTALFFAGLAYELTCDPYLIPFAKQMYMEAFDIERALFGENHPVLANHAAALSLLHEALDETCKAHDMEVLYNKCDIESFMGNDISAPIRILAFWKMISLINVRSKLRIFLMHPNNTIHPLEAASISLVVNIINNSDLDLDNWEDDHNESISGSETDTLIDGILKSVTRAKHMVIYNHGYTALHVQNKPFSASHLFKSAIDVQLSMNGSPPSLRFNTYVGLGQAYEMLEWYPEAVEAFSNALEIEVGEKPHALKEETAKLRDLCTLSIERCIRQQEINNVSRACGEN